jgi:hypothetical protein
MRFIKPRKPRGKKMDGTPSLDMCSCFAFYCDPSTMSRKFSQKISRRRSAGLCPCCGNKQCVCKSSRLLRVPRMVVGGKV